MVQLPKSFVQNCRQDRGRYLRGENMTRIETFVDAAFAFSLTLLVISIDEIPDNTAELLELSKDIPAFLASAIVIGAIWVSHAEWSRTFGLQDNMTICLSLALVMLVLIFIYPIKLVFMAIFNYWTFGYLSPNFAASGGWPEVSNMFIYFAIGIMCLSLLVISLYQNTLRYRDELHLVSYEIFFCKRRSIDWTVVFATALVSYVWAIVTTGPLLAWAGFLFGSLSITLPLTNRYFARFDPTISASDN
jgi:uncharacterized membrane protein